MIQAIQFICVLVAVAGSWFLGFDAGHRAAIYEQAQKDSLKKT